jgi:hypothetical protein
VGRFKVRPSKTFIAAMGKFVRCGGIINDKARDRPSQGSIQESRERYFQTLIA